MATDQNTIQEVLPKKGLAYSNRQPIPVLCKPKILPLKSVTLEKLEKMQKNAQEAVKKQEREQTLLEQQLEEPPDDQL